MQMINCFIVFLTIAVVFTGAQQNGKTAIRSCCQKGASHAKVGGVCSNHATSLTSSEAGVMTCIVMFQECCQYAQRTQCQMGMTFAKSGLVCTGHQSVRSPVAEQCCNSCKRGLYKKRTNQPCGARTGGLTGSALRSCCGAAEKEKKAEEKKRKEEEEAKKKAMITKKKEEEEVKLKKAEEERLFEEAKRKFEEEAKKKEEDEIKKIKIAKIKAEEMKAAKEAKRLFEEAKKKFEEEAKKKAEVEKKEKAKAEELRKKAEEAEKATKEAKRLFEEAKKKFEEEAKKKAKEEQAKKKAEEEKEKKNDEKCKDGFEKNSKGECEDINECRVQGKNLCRHRDQSCWNEQGFYRCVWNCNYPKYRKSILFNKYICEDVDECKERRDNCDRSTHDCINRVGGFTCKLVRCKPGFKMVGKTCREIDHCSAQNNPCLAGQYCHKTTTRAYCIDESCPNDRYYVKRLASGSPIQECAKTECDRIRDVADNKLCWTTATFPSLIKRYVYNYYGNELTRGQFNFKYWWSFKAYDVNVKIVKGDDRREFYLSFNGDELEITNQRSIKGPRQIHFVMQTDVKSRRENRLVWRYQYDFFIYVQA